MRLKWILLLIPAVLLVGYTPKASYTVTGIVYLSGQSSAIEGVKVTVKENSLTTVTGKDGKFAIEVPGAKATLVFEKTGYRKVIEKVKGRSAVTTSMSADLATQPVEAVEVEEDIEIFDEIADYFSGDKATAAKRERRSRGMNQRAMALPPGRMPNQWMPGHPYPIEGNTEDYAEINETGFQRPQKTPLSTFSIDVDAASYSNVRRFLNNGQLPPADAVRVEEMVNYFNYDYAQPKGDVPFSINTEVAAAPWNKAHQLVHIGLQGLKIDTKDLPASNLVFLLDVSGSMNASNKLPLLKSAFKLLVAQLRPEDKVSIVVYAGAAGLVLEPTAGDKKTTILNALNNLSAGGSTAGGAGINLAYAKAKEHFVKGGNNRVILATDGDFNVGASSNKAMEQLIEEKRNDGIYLTVLGFGMGNYKDSKMEVLADKGNGNYAYIDNIQEAKKVLVNEFGGTMYTIAKDVKIQVEFNPANVQGYRLIGYENRRLADEDFNNDKKDAGELGAGHTVTALYEIIPAGIKSDALSVDPLKYQKVEAPKKENFSDELMTVKLRYKKPEGSDKSRLISKVITKKDIESKNTSVNFKWSAAVAVYGMVLRNSQYAGEYAHKDIVALAEQGRGEDAEGYRAEFIRLVKSSRLLSDAE